jgi:hypothetical protein
MKPDRDAFDWMYQAIYEPTPAPRYAARNRFTPVFVTLAIIAIVTGGLIAWSHLS